MLIYKIDNDEDINSVLTFGENLNRVSNKNEDFNYMIGLVIENYKNYFRASSYLQSRYDFSLQAIYSCLSKVNNDENRLNAYKELSKFLNDVKQRSGINMQIRKEKSTLYVKERPKVKTKFRKRLAA